MSAPWSSRDQAVDLLTTHRHGDDKQACEWCASFYGDIVDRLADHGFLADP